MEPTRKNYNALLKQFKDCEKTIIGIEERKRLAAERLEEAKKSLVELTAGKNPDEVLAKLGKEVEIRMETLRSKIIELERIVVDFKSESAFGVSRTDLGEFDL